MRIVLTVSSNNEHCNGGCEYALVDLTPELAVLALKRIATFRDQKNLDPDIVESHYWAYFAEYFSPWVDLASPEKGVDVAGVMLEDMLDELPTEEEEIISVPEAFQVPSHQIAAVECQQMIVRDCIAFMAIPKHASYYVQTAEVPLAMLEAAAATSAASIPV